MLHCWIGDYNEYFRVHASANIMLAAVMVYVVAVRISGSVEVVFVNDLDASVMYPIDRFLIL